MKHVNYVMRDPAVYRIRYTPHPHIGNKWCIYPLYDFTHGICDSLENITHSLCTLEFEIRRDLYYWILNELDIYRPFVWEYSRLNITNTVLSKRKLHHLVHEKIVSGWDDPRILTLNGLRRRGYTPEAINNFCDQVGVTRRGNENFININLLEHCCRLDLDQRAQRRLVVIDPVKLVITNVESDFEFLCTLNHFPRDASLGTYQVPAHKELYVERDDCSLEDHAEFFGFTVGKLVGLKYFGVVVVKSVKTDQNGNIQEVQVEWQKDSQQKPKSYLHWVSAKESVECETRLYDILFTCPEPQAEDKWLEMINPESLTTNHHSRMPSNLKSAQTEERFQFERLGYFILDKDSTSEKFVWNRIVTLSEKLKKKAIGNIEQKKKQ